MSPCRWVSPLHAKTPESFDRRFTIQYLRLQRRVILIRPAGDGHHAQQLDEDVDNETRRIP